MVTWVAAAGRCAFPAFLVTRVTPPLSPSAGAMPTAYSRISIKTSSPYLVLVVVEVEQCVRAYLGVGKAAVLEQELASLPSIFPPREPWLGGQRAYLARVKVNQVQRVARELDALALDDVRVLATYSQVISLHSHIHTQFIHPNPQPIRRPLQSPSLPLPKRTALPFPTPNTAGYSGQKRTSNLPDQVIGDKGRVVCGRHGWRYFRIWRIDSKIQDFRLQKRTSVYRFAEYQY